MVSLGMQFLLWTIRGTKIYFPLKFKSSPSHIVINLYYYAIRDL